MSINVVYPPARPKRLSAKELEVFLAGSIEMGLAEDWQTQVINSLPEDRAVTIYNPRRKDWDSSWKQEISNPQFYSQVNWEQDKISESHVVFFYFDPETKSPISLMELGHVLAASNVYLDIIVCCPTGFWRKGNIDIMCERHSVDVYENLESAIDQLKRIIIKST